MLADSQEAKAGTVLAASRRAATLIDSFGNILEAVTASRHLDIVAGDKVTFHTEKGESFIDTVSVRRNCFSRQYQDKHRDIAANLDHLFIIGAADPLFNTVFIDRTASIANYENIPVTILVNKMDLETGDTEERIRIYESVGFRVIRMSVKSGLGVDKLLLALSSPSVHICALTGISGVGKTTIINRLIPDANRRTAEVSKRTGQGKQTTTSAFGHLYPRQGQSALVLIDLPGIQSVGVGHLSKSHLADTFPEIIKLRPGCKFSDCAHTKETHCAVKHAVEIGEMALSRYESYCSMLQEIKEANAY